MQQHPTTGIIGGKPKTRLKTAKDPLLSERYLKLRNRQMSHKAAEAELNLAVRRGQLISKELVTRQAHLSVYRDAAENPEPAFNLCTQADRLAGCSRGLEDP